MAFSWISVAAGTEITSAQWNEVKTNTDTIISNLGIGAYSWSEMPVAQNISKPDVADTQELRNALDYAHNNNTCSAENNTYDSGYDSVKDNAIQNPYNATLHSVADATVDTTRDVNYDNARVVTLHTDRHSTYYSPNDGTYNSSRNLTYGTSDIRLKRDIVYI